MFCHALFCHVVLCYALFCSVLSCSSKARGAGPSGTVGGPGDLASAVCRVGGPGGLFWRSNNPNLSGGEQFCYVKFWYVLSCSVLPRYESLSSSPECLISSCFHMHDNNVGTRACARSLCCIMYMRSHTAARDRRIRAACLAAEHC